VLWRVLWGRAFGLGVASRVGSVQAEGPGAGAEREMHAASEWACGAAGEAGMGHAIFV